MYVIIYYLSLRVAVGRLFSEVVNNHGKSGTRRRRRRFVLYTLSPFIFNRRAEPQRKLQTSRPLSCAEERAEPGQVAKPKLLNEHSNPVCVCPLRFFPFVCVCPAAGG